MCGALCRFTTSGVPMSVAFGLGAGGIACTYPGGKPIHSTIPSTCDGHADASGTFLWKAAMDNLPLLVMLATFEMWPEGRGALE